MVFSPKPISSTQPSYDAIVIGSGYGGGVAASRLARMGMSVAVFEQGRNWRPGEFPTTVKAQRKTTRFAGRAPRLGNATALYYLSVGNGLTVFGASGLGGGSLINAGVTLRPNLDRLRACGWPSAILSDGHLLEGLARAETMLGVASAPEPERFAKYRGMGALARAAGRNVSAPPMTISHRPGENVSGVMQYACRNCGDCWSGCNAGAKNTVGITYIADAVDHGASVFCEAQAQSIAKTAQGWEVVVNDATRKGASRRVAAPIAVLAAGTLGTNELLLRARQRGLKLSEKLGQKFSANGDDLVIATDLEEPVHAIARGFPTRTPRDPTMIGPHSMALIDLSDEHGPIWAHDGTMLTMMAHLAPFKNLIQRNFKASFQQLWQGIYGDRMSRTQLIYVVAEDDAGGRLSLEKDRVVVDWPDYSSSPSRIRAEEKVKDMIERAGGRFNTNPFAMSAFGGNRVIAHPLGGCAMGNTVDDGVVAHDGRVFDPSQGPTGVHEGLYVCDGAAIPSAIGVSPLLTITAVAERAMMLAADRLGRKLDIETVPQRPVRDAGM